MSEPVVVTTQAELDQALADAAETIYIQSKSGVWLTITDSGSSRVVARGSSRVVASGSSSVEARGSSRVVARDSSSVVAWGSSRVVASGSSSVEARGSSRVEASKYAAVHLWSQRVTLTGSGHVIDMTAIDFTDPAQWCEYYGVEVAEGIAHLYKAVDDQWTTEYGTVYAPGTTPEAPDWNTAPQCGGGLHLCASPSGSRSFKPDAARFVRCGVRLDEMVCLDDKVKVKRVVVPCVEVDIHGDLVEAVTA